MGIWVYRDAESRGMNGVLWLLVVLVAGLIGIIIYFVVRHDHRPPLYPAYVPPPWTPTPGPAQAMPGATPLTCKNCGAALATGATFCSKCGTKV
ncbi:MAG: zinc ribbon domain-containing protein [Methanobacteriota archaeon]|nr:MAG: zinc ribbon domain-containing protein [Euryarchaeota archaeon]